MKKQDLKSMMVVETRNGRRFMVINNSVSRDIITNGKNFLFLDEYNNDLSYRGIDNDNQWDIIRVINNTLDNPNPFKNIIDFINKDDLILWEAKPVYEVDDLLLVSNNGSIYQKRYFSHYDDDALYCFKQGRTSKTAEDENDVYTWIYHKKFEEC